MPSQTTTDFLSRVRRKAQWPDDAKLTDAQILQVADEEIASFIYPLIRGVGEAYNVKRYTVACVTGTATYRIPSRATSGTVFDVTLVDSMGGGRRLNKVQTADAYFVNETELGTPTAYAIEGDQIRLLPTPGADFSLMVRYERRPSDLVVVASCALISAVGSNSLDSSTDLGLTSFDIAQALPNFDALYDDLAMTISGTFTYTAAETLTGIVVGDYICVPGQTCVVPVPDALYPVLIDKVAAEMLSEAGDVAGEARVLAHMERLLSGAMESLAPRAETSSPAVFNRWSPLRNG